MNESRYAVRVGLFVLLGLVLLGALLMTFSKGVSFLTPTYQVNLKANSVGGLKNNANVLLSGVPVGKVAGFDLAPDGRSVLIQLVLETRYRDQIHADARFVIEQLGLLGDQYVEISPEKNAAPPVQPGQTIEAEEPLSIQGTARTAKGLLEQASDTLKTINAVLQRADQTILSLNSLSNVAVALENFSGISQRASRMVDNIDRMISSNSPAIAGTVSNLSAFSKELNRLTAEIGNTFSTNRLELSKAVQSLENTSHVLEGLAQDVESGKGAAGLLLRDPEFKQQLSQVASNFTVFSRNLNEHGLLHNLFFKPKAPEPEKSPKK
jgi:phospholipid/cholesterol/gamma-HCH transport system substrate-binding protein